jgi:hypothetical protein
MHMTYHSEEDIVGTDRPALEVKITEEMVHAAKRVMARFDPEFCDWEDGAKRVLEAALVAGGHLFPDDCEFMLPRFLSDEIKLIRDISAGREEN